MISFIFLKYPQQSVIQIPLMDISVCVKAALLGHVTCAAVAFHAAVKSVRAYMDFLPTMSSVSQSQVRKTAEGVTCTESIRFCLN